MRYNIIINAPVDTFSGYGSRARDFLKQFIDIYDDRFNIFIQSTGWGHTPVGFLKTNREKWKTIIDRIETQDTIKNLDKDIVLHLGTSLEAPDWTKDAKLKINVTAGIESSVYAPGWIQGMNYCDVVFFSSKHGKDVALSTSYTHEETGQILKVDTNKVILDIIKQGSDETVFTNKYQIINEQLDNQLNSIKQDFCFLVMGNIIQMGVGVDRKDIYNTLLTISKTFENQDKRPAIILKANKVDYSTIDKFSIINDLQTIKNELNIQIYLLHSQLTDEQVNQLYNHQKVKCLVSFTHGQGYGRPLQEFAFTGKPVIVSNWSGLTDFMKYPHILLKGGLEKILHNNQMFVKGSMWFNVDYEYAKLKLKQVYQAYQKYYEKTNKLRQRFIQTNSIQSMKKIIQTKFNNIFTIKGFN